jgi:hypothetical protein
MKLINNKDDPDLLGIIEYEEDFVDVAKIVENMNKDLIDSGFDQYQYKAEKQGQKAYIRRI